MKRTTAILSILLAGGFLTANAKELLITGPVRQQAAAQEVPIQNNLLPVPANITWQEGSLPIAASFTVKAKGAVDSRVQGAVKRFTARLQKRTGVTFTDVEAKSDQPSLFIEVLNKGLAVQTVREDESYKLVVTPQQATLTASNPLGVLRGLQTLLQLTQLSGSSVSFPAVTIQDIPRFAWRGLLIDSCRHWLPVEVMQRNLDGMEEAKLNVLHWHLSEYQGFRVESLKYPKLQELGSKGDYYTQQQIKDLIEYARQRGIRVVPEFDMPGHAAAMITAYPELGSGPGPYEIGGHQQIDPAIDPTRESVYNFIDGFVSEMAALFPDEYFHIGGDEVAGVEWNLNPDVRDFMYEHNLRNNEDLQAYFNSRLSKIVTNHHKKMVGWDEIFRPDLPKTTVVHSWRGYDSLADAARKGYDTILSNGYYLDLIYPASTHYLVDPLPDVPPVSKSSKKKADTDAPPPPLTAEQKSHVLGGEACMWSEYVDRDTIDSRIWPRMLGVAERLWSPSSTRDLEDFYRRMAVESHNLGEVGLTHESNYPILLKKLTGDGPIEPMKVLADVVEPVKGYFRGRFRPYTQDVPLTRLVDVARPESEVARQFKKQVDAFLADTPKLGNAELVRKTLILWADNHKQLDPILKKSTLAHDARIISRELSTVAQYGLDSLMYLQSGKSAPAEWLAKATQALNEDQEADEAVFLVNIPSIRKLVYAAGMIGEAKEGKSQEWLTALDAQVTADSPKPREW